MARPKTITRESILKAAREVFMKKGFQASTSAVAKAAGVSEGSIFNHFQSKAELFHEALAPPEIDPDTLIFAHLSEAPVREQVEALALSLINHLRKILPRFMMIWASRGGFDVEEFKNHRRAGGLKLLKAVTHFFDKQIQDQRIRPCDPEIVARALLGSVHNFVFFETVGVHMSMPMAAHSFVRGLVDVILHGIEAKSSPDEEETK